MLCVAFQETRVTPCDATGQLGDPNTGRSFIHRNLYPSIGSLDIHIIETRKRDFLLNVQKQLRFLKCEFKVCRYFRKHSPFGQPRSLLTIEKTMSTGGRMTLLVESFSRYFRVVLAVTRQQKRYAHAIRYQVYAKELGWEPLNESGLETDKCDDYSTHCLLEHKRSGEIVGCVRLVIPPAGETSKQLPSQIHGMSLNNDLLRAAPIGEIGEISRLAVPYSFRCHAKKRIPKFLDDCDAITYSDEERRNFSNISLGLYYASIAMVDLNELDHALVFMEPRLSRCLGRYGLQFHQTTHTYELKGRDRAVYALPRNELTVGMNLSQLALYRQIRSDLLDQFQLEFMKQSHANQSLQVSNRVVWKY
jgi:N-acyl amino acid synthase of PEP-CTERM/exosortase system